jgi:vacuolar-type H+-ATPase subunit H
MSKKEEKANKALNKMREIVLKYESDKELMNQKFQIEKNKYIYKKDEKIIKDKKKNYKKIKS